MQFGHDSDFATSNIAQTSLTLSTAFDSLAGGSGASDRVSISSSLTAQDQLRLSRTDIIPHELDNASCMASIPVKDEGWLSTLHIAAQKGNDRIIHALVQRNIDCNEKDSDGRTPLMYAVVGDRETVVDTLLSHGARLSEVDHAQRSALHWAVLCRRESVLRILLRHYSEYTPELNIDAYDLAGWTPLHIAVARNFELGVLMLLQCGANSNFKARKPPLTGNMISGQPT
ncbi:MAG: hypothetical protein M1821_007890 [Bathelium mastoideum]|nr:MAG: hypothetical protein M1821_007890 [Bathelium mastoideum]KAI9692938.1 MAG: hypothetical protein M1822_004933 [Bathelium mastoideum]